MRHGEGKQCEAEYGAEYSRISELGASASINEWFQQNSNRTLRFEAHRLDRREGAVVGVAAASNFCAVRDFLSAVRVDRRQHPPKSKVFCRQKPPHSSEK
jgi:hypothetical protein